MAAITTGAMDFILKTLEKLTSSTRRVASQKGGMLSFSHFQAFRSQLSSQVIVGAGHCKILIAILSLIYTKSVYGRTVILNLSLIIFREYFQQHTSMSRTTRRNPQGIVCYLSPKSFQETYM